MDRREALKLLSIVPATIPSTTLRGLAKDRQPNILVLVLDAFSSHNIPFLGYKRNTTPLLNQWVNRAVVYHDHYASGPFTTPGTASLLTGVLPWTHRAIRVFGEVVKPFDADNIFGEFYRQGYYNLAYTHNPLVNTLLAQFIEYIPGYVPSKDLMLKTGWGFNFAPHDFDIIDRLQKKIFSNSVRVSDDFFFGETIGKRYANELEDINNHFATEFPLELPSVDNRQNLFNLETGINWLIQNTNDLPQPFFGYFHFFPPHSPYNTRAEFIDLFNDDITFLEKPYHPLANKLSHKVVNRHRKQYDEYIAYVDAELNRLLQSFEASGVLDHTWVIITSDHGEMFERGIWGHTDVTLHQPVIQIPLLIFEPGRNKREDVYKRTSAIDILPTLLHTAGFGVPEWCQGKIMPPYRSGVLPPRNIYSVLARNNGKYAPLEKTTITMLSKEYKLVYYLGYEKLPENTPYFELYNIFDDPEEMVNLYNPTFRIFNNLNDELQEVLNKVNYQFER